MDDNRFQKKYYKIREVSELTGLPLSTLRFWEAQFPGYLHPKRNDGGTRFYTPADLETVQMLKYLIKEKGLKLDAAKAQLKANPEGVIRRYQTIARLQHARNILHSMLKALDALRR
ncbi:MAG: MerR family transcriptional regulator [Muribaculaceae bacterium]|nr:MerR family transcriptional regulator [Muribaculaceae bacterium]